VQERSTTAPSVSYTRGVDLSASLDGAGGIGGFLARSHGFNSGTGAWSTHSAYHADGNGNVTALFSTSTGSQVAWYRYDAFGRTLQSSGSLASANRMRFSSKPWMAPSVDDSAGMYYYGYRFYDPLTQRWLNRDPIGENGDRNIYRAMRGNPISVLDSFGQLGTNFLPTADPLCKEAEKFIALADEQDSNYYVACHGSEFALYESEEREIRIAEAAKRIKADPNWNPGRIVILLACRTGRSPEPAAHLYNLTLCPGAMLSKALGCPVQAPNKELWWKPPIRRSSLADLEVMGTFGPPKDGLPNPADPGEWLNYYPDM